MYYLYGVIEACLKVTIGMFHFYHSKNLSHIMKNVFNSISVYTGKNIFVSKYKKQMCY